MNRTPSYIKTPLNPYRFGFNGMEADNEFKGSGNSYDFGARIYDSRLGRFLSIDPLFSAFPSESNYIFSGNSPILYIDVDGKFKLEFSEEQLREWGVTEQQLQSFVNILNNIQSLVESNENAMQALINTTKLSRDEILKDLKNDGDGPVIKFMEGSRANAGSEMMEIGVEIIKNLTFEDLDTYEQAFGIALVILDEYSHIGDKRRNEGLSTGDSDLPETNRAGKQNWPWSPVGHRGEDPSVFGFGLRFSIGSSGKIFFQEATKNDIKEGRNYPGTENIPTGFNRPAIGSELIEEKH
ncbi:MAG: hypothetical protein PHT69_05225 [Bacteroidales bacterium]|nr:hypothetical protein [Bacteroidales bacterium]